MVTLTACCWLVLTPNEVSSLTMCDDVVHANEGVRRYVSTFLMPDAATFIFTT